MQNCIKPEHIANALRMKRTLHHGSFLILEGPHDVLVFSELIDHESCRMEIGYGKHNVVEAIRLLNRSHFHGALAIVDSDFRNIQFDGIDEPNLLFTDDHDIECTMLRSTALERVLTEFGVPERIEAFANQHGGLVGYAMAKGATALGHLLLVSLNNDYGLVFDNLSFSKFVDSSKLQISITEMLTEVRNKSQKHSLDWDAIEQHVTMACRAGHDPWQVCSGHHLIDILSLAFRHTFAAHKGNEVAPELLAKCLRLAYHTPQFVGTSLHKAILAWEAANPPVSWRFKRYHSWALQTIPFTGFCL